MLFEICIMTRTCFLKKMGKQAARWNAQHRFTSFTPSTRFRPDSFTSDFSMCTQKSYTTAAMSSDMFLYWGSGFPPCWTAMIALEEKGFGGYPNKKLSFAKKEHKGEEVLKLNPRGQLPTFRHGPIVINEAHAIVDYLESTYPNKGYKLLPGDPAKRAMALQRRHEARNLQSNSVDEYRRWMQEKPEERDQADVAEDLSKFREELAHWERILSSLGGNSYIAGADFTVADACLFPWVALLWRLGVNLERYPQLKAYFERTKQRPSIQASWPPHWKSSPPDPKNRHIFFE